MLIYDPHAIGNRLFAIRKKQGLTQARVAELSGIGDRTYADIERGAINTRIETLLRICDALHITPDEVLTEESSPAIIRETEILERLSACTPKERATAFQLLETYLRSLN